MSKRIMVWEMGWHHLRWRRQRVFTIVAHLLILLIFIIVIASTFVLEVGGAFVFMRLAILRRS